MDRQTRQLERLALAGGPSAKARLERTLERTSLQGRLLFVTVRASAAADLFPDGEVVHEFDAAKIWHSFCCRDAEHVGQMPAAVVLQIRTLLSRKGLQKLKHGDTWRRPVRRIRAKPPEGGWATLDRGTIWTVMC